MNTHFEDAKAGAAVGIVPRLRAALEKSNPVLPPDIRLRAVASVA